MAQVVSKHEEKERWPTPRRARAEELIDSFDHPLADFDRSFTDIRRINRYLGGTSVVLRRLSDLLRDDRGPIRILDVGTGSGDIPMALAEWARRRGQSLSVTAVDVNPKVLSLAQRLTGECPEVRLVQSSGADLAFRDDSFDFAISSLTFHHFDEDLAARVLGEMHRIARRGVIVNDLQRGYLPAGLIWLVTRVTRMHPLTQHDAPLSVMRALTVSEYRELAVRAGVPGAQVYKHPFWRAALVARKGE